MNATVEDVRAQREALRAKAQAAIARLTPACQDVLRLVAKGYTYGQTAAALGKAEPTVRAQVYRSYKELNIQTAQQVATLFTLAGEITNWEG